MSDTTIPALLLDIDPDEAVVTFNVISCRACPETSGWVRNRHDEQTAHYDWQRQHVGATGHRQFYVFTMSRGTARAF